MCKTKYVTLVNEEFFRDKNYPLTKEQVDEAVFRLNNLIEASGIHIYLYVEPAAHLIARGGYTLFITTLPEKNLYTLFDLSGVHYGKPEKSISKQYIKI